MSDLLGLERRGAPWMRPDAPTPTCATVDPELWFPERGASPAIAKRLCTSCPLLAACRRWALAHPAEARFGVWGGLTERERRAARRRGATVVPDREAA